MGVKLTKRERFFLNMSNGYFRKGDRKKARHYSELYKEAVFTRLGVWEEFNRRLNEIRED